MTTIVYKLFVGNGSANHTCDLRPYQKQALYWMTEWEKGVDVGLHIAFAMITIYYFFLKVKRIKLQFSEKRFIFL
ncbi:hypothetical protein Hanom_Chr04g00291831 [Helianthus anomalus]